MCTSAEELVPVHTVPGSPRNLTPKNIDGAKVTLSWVAPVTDGGSPLTGYVIMYCDAEKNKYKTCGHVEADCLEFTSDKLKRGKEYKFKLFAHNNIGLSDSGAEIGKPVEIKENAHKTVRL